ncbi:cysteine-rich CWC family protein [Paenibacillus filicis]|uniref:Cysteine-rich CWC family protein n=1 Tax=Paenibacillus filicis TaxID=669464 RepID=A0ABU9DMK3_9BACL
MTGHGYREEAHPHPEASRCPLCGQDNQCALLQGKQVEACWCWKASIPKGLLERISDPLRGRACVCPSCVQLYRKEQWQPSMVSRPGRKEDAEAIDAFRLLQAYADNVRVTIGASAAAVIVMQHGRVLHEAYTGTHGPESGARRVDAQSRFNVGSARKSYLGLVIAWAIHDGLIGSLDDPVSAYTPEHQDADLLYGTTIRHLLTHTHGLNRSGGRDFAPGASWSYNNFGVNLLIELAGRLYRKPFVHILEERIFRPCGFTATGWEKRRLEDLVWLDESYPDDEGKSANLFVSARELASWGQLYLQGGVYEGARVVPASVIRQAISVATPEGLDLSWPRNGYFWQVQEQPCVRTELGDELPAGSFQMLGITGCAVLVIPELEIVAVRMYNQTGGNPEGYSYLEDIRGFGNLVQRAVKAREA